MQLIPLALCLVAGSVQTIALSSSVMSLYNMSMDGAGGSIMDASGSPLNVTILGLNNMSPPPPIQLRPVTGGITKTQYNMQMTYLILACLGLLFGLLVLTKPDMFDTDSGKIIVSVVTLLWLVVTFITCATANAAFSNTATFQNNINTFVYKMFNGEGTPNFPILHTDLSGNVIPLKNKQTGFMTSYFITSLLLIASIAFTIM